MRTYEVFLIGRADPVVVQARVHDSDGETIAFRAAEGAEVVLSVRYDQVQAIRTRIVDS